MGLYASWSHGSALTIESPESVTRIGHFGWGADMLIESGKRSWFHISIPTPVLVNGVQSKLVRAFLLFEVTSGEIRNVHIFDGPNRVQEFNDLHLTGAHQNRVDTSNTFKLTNPHSVFLGIGISFLFVAQLVSGGPFGAAPPIRLLITSAGGDFTT